LAFDENRANKMREVLKKTFNNIITELDRI